MGWNPIDDQLLEGDALEAQAPDESYRARLEKARAERKVVRTPWKRFKDTLLTTTLHSPWGGEAVVRHGMRAQGYSDEEINARERRIFHDEKILNARDDEAFQNVDTFSPQNIGKWANDLVASFIGGVDPTYVIAPGRKAFQRILAQGAINAGMDAASQGVEKIRGTREEYDPMQTAINAIVGVGMQGAGEAVSKVNAGRRISTGSRLPNFDDLLARVVHLEGGGTLANPKTSPKGAKGPMQVMDATARDPGFGIRPWDGKTEADRARVGRQYLAALNHKYNGDSAKVLAAYNGGPGRVDAAVKKYGPEWLRAMPLESRNYVRNGLGGDSMRGPQWAAADEVFSNSPAELRDVISPRRADTEPDLEPIQDALMRQAEGDSGGFTDNVDPWTQGWANRSLEAKPEVPTKDELDVLYKQATEAEDAYWKADYASMDTKTHDKLWETKHNALTAFQDALELYHNKTVPGLSWSAKGMKTSFEKPGTPEFDKKYGYSDTEANKYEQQPYEEPDDYGLDDPDLDFEPETTYDKVNGKDTALPYYAPYENGKQQYNGVEDYEKVTGKKVSPLLKEAIKKYAKENWFSDATIGSHYFSDTGDGDVHFEVDKLKDAIAKDKMTPKEYKAYLKIDEGDPVPKILKKYLEEPQPPRVPTELEHRIRRTGETFVKMLQDTRGGAFEPDTFHEAITEWNKGTHYLMKGSDGTPMRIYHGTHRAYDGLPSGEKNEMPPGYVLYSTDPSFASSYAKFHEGDAYSLDPYTATKASRVFPAYVKNDSRIADFRKPEDLKKAVDWYKKKYGEEGLRWGTEHDLARGHWPQWERPDMLEDLGWRGAFMTEGGSLNVMLKDDLVMSVLDPKTYKNDTIAHKIVKTLTDLLKDESGSYRITDPLDDMDPDERTLLDALKNARKISGETRSLHRAEKGKRGAQLGRIQQEGLGETGLYAQMKQAKGEMPHADFESLRGAFSQDQIDNLLNKINVNKALLPWEKFNASMAMGKLIGLEGANFSKAPTMSEIKLLEKVYSSKLISALMEDQTFTQKLVQGLQKTLSIPRAIMSSMDLSAPFRQGLNYVHKPEFWKSFGHMFTLIGSETNSKALMDEIYSRPTWELMKRAKLAITDPHSHFMNQHEEGFQGSDWAERIPILGSIGIKASNRAYSGFLNKLRADVFDDYVRQYEKAGINLATDTQKLRQVAAFVNAATGRGNLPKRMEAAAPFLANVFFSPRLIASRLKFITNPMTYLNSDPILRKEAWKSAFSLAAVALSVAALGKYGLGMDLETDPRSSDFMKPKVGNTRYDVMGGYQQYITLAARFITQQDKTSGGDIRDFDKDNPTANTRGKAVLKFARNKLSPVASFVTDWLMGKDTVGRDFSLPRAAYDRLHPMAVGDIADAYKEWGGEGVPMASPGIFGVGVQTYDPAELKAEKAAKKEAKKKAKEAAKEDLNGFEDDTAFNIQDWNF